MWKSNSKRWALGWIVIALAGTASNAAARAPEISAVFTVHIRNYANVDSKTLVEAEKAAREIFGHAGVGIEWDDQAVENALEINPGEKGDHPSFGLSDLWLGIYPRAMAEALRLPEKVMGLAPGAGPDRQLVYVFYDYVKALAERQVQAMRHGEITRRATGGQILGHMIAHELGHVLLNQPFHSAVGIMRGDWDLNDLQEAAFGSLFFTSSQGAVLRSEVARRAEQSAMAAAERHGRAR